MKTNPGLVVHPTDVSQIGTATHRRWDIGCLYNRETEEHPQLFFSHRFKTGNPL